MFEAYEAFARRRLRFINEFLGLSQKQQSEQPDLIPTDFSSEQFISFLLGKTCLPGCDGNRDPIVQLALSQIISWATELKVRTDQDRELLGSVVRTHDLGADPHTSGIPVLVEATNGTFVYKPRPVTLDYQYNTLIGRLKDMGLSTRIGQTYVVDCKEYGYVQYIQRRPNPVELSEHDLEVVGGILALVYVLSGRDFHYENIVFSDDGVLLVDLEGLLQPAISISPSFDDGTLDVLNTGILPARVVSSDAVDFDPSVLGSGHYRFMENWSHSVGSVRKGFENTYKFLLQHQDAIIEDPAFLGMQAARSRFIPSSTVEYYSKIARYIYKTYQDGDTDAYLNSLRSDDNVFQAFLESEVLSIKSLCVPIFYHKNSTKIIESEFGKPVTEVARSGFSEACIRLSEKISNSDMRRQSWFIQQSFEVHALHHGVSLENASSDFVPIEINTKSLLSALQFYHELYCDCLKEDGQGQTLTVFPTEASERWALSAHLLDEKENQLRREMSSIVHVILDRKREISQKNQSYITERLNSAIRLMLAIPKQSLPAKRPLTSNGFYISKDSGICASLLTAAVDSDNFSVGECQNFLEAYNTAQTKKNISFGGQFSCINLSFTIGLPCLILCLCIVAMAFMNDDKNMAVT